MIRTTHPPTSKEFVRQSHPNRPLAFSTMETRRISISVVAAFASLAIGPTLAAAGSLAWEQTKISVDADFGQKEVNAYYVFTNSSDRAITISKTSASCGCTLPSLEKDTYAPGESGKLLATFDIGNRVGKQHKEITVETQEYGESQSYVLTLDVNIPQLIELKRRALLWRVGEEPGTKDCEIVIHSSRPMTIDEVVIKKNQKEESMFIFEIEEIEPRH
ncbi:MAG TPA: hypothetical protein DCS60_02890, partial [Opitutae bacterium]|nr:hypothetical protein [Opitutae bacterium]